MVKLTQAVRSSDAKRCVLLLRSRNEVKSQEAEQALVQMGEEGQAAILKYAEGFETRLLLRVALPFNLTQALLGAGGSMAIIFGIGKLLHLHEGVILFLCIPAIIGGILLNAIKLGPWLIFPPGERRFFRLVTKSEDVRMIPVLLSAYHGRMMTPSIGIAEALTRLLPRLSDATSIGLSSHQRSTLYALAGGRMNGGRPSTDLTLAALHALPLLGDSSSIAVVKALLAKSSTANNPDLREAAQLCLQALETKFGKIASNATLLRASQPSRTTAAQELLRSTAENAPIATEHLLRATEQQSPSQQMETR